AVSNCNQYRLRSNDGTGKPPEQLRVGHTQGFSVFRRCRINQESLVAIGYGGGAFYAIGILQGWLGSNPCDGPMQLVQMKNSIEPMNSTFSSFCWEVQVLFVAFRSKHPSVRPNETVE